MGLTILPQKFYDKLDTQNALLASIASHTGTEGIKVSNWEDVQTLVRMGLADKMFKVGDQFISSYDTGQVVWDVIGINHDIPTDEKYTTSLTLQAHDCIMNCQFDAPELLYYAEVELAAGTYYFNNSYDTKNYSFTTTIAIPAGGGIEVSAWGGSENPTEVKTYDASNVLFEALTLTEAATGVLITCNDLRRVRYGSNNYVESNIRQWLNSDAAMFTYTKTSIYSKPSTGAPYVGAGYLNLLDQELVAVLGAVNKQVARNTVTDGGGQDLFSDKIFLLSRVEVFGGTEGYTSGENPYPWYSALAANPTINPLIGRIKYLSGSARTWWLRSPYTGSAYHPRSVITTGNVSYNSASNAYGLAPACCII